MLQRIRSGLLDQAYLSYGDPHGWPVVLLHGFPYDPRCWDEIGPELAYAGAYVIAPYLRGFGPTRFRSEDTMRSGEQAALGYDLLALLDALNLSSTLLVGFDWGGRAACVVSALWPQRVRGLVTMNGYNIQDIAGSTRPAPAAAEHRLWYQYYFHSERGREALRENPRDVCELLWRQWSPSWRFARADFARSAESFDNPDFADVVAHSYRHRFGLVPGDPICAPIEARLAMQPPITVPTMSLIGDNDGVIGPLKAGATPPARDRFTADFEFRVISDAGHNLPQERQDECLQAILDVHRAAGSIR